MKESKFKEANLQNDSLLGRWYCLGLHLFSYLPLEHYFVFFIFLISPSPSPQFKTLSVFDILISHLQMLVAQYPVIPSFCIFVDIQY